jgi:hypothetical protein
MNKERKEERACVSGWMKEWLAEFLKVFGEVTYIEKGDPRIYWGGWPHYCGYICRYSGLTLFLVVVRGDANRFFLSYDQSLLHRVVWRDIKDEDKLWWDGVQDTPPQVDLLGWLIHKDLRE